MGASERRALWPRLALLLLTLMAAAPATPTALDGAGDAVRRQAMVAEQIARRGVTDGAVLAAMTAVPRHLFVPAEERAAAYADQPLPIGHEQTISQPYVVALMTSLLQVRPGSRVLEIGTGSGYQAAVLAQMGAQVWSIEIVAPLGEQARQTLARLGYDRVQVRIGDGYQGWPEAAPFDAIVLTAAPETLPAPLLAQLKPGGRLVAPLGAAAQELTVIDKGADGGIATRSVLPVRFVPMTGRAQQRP